MKITVTFLMLLVLCSPNTDAITVERQRSFIGHIDGVSSVAFSPDGSVLASGGAGQDSASSGMSRKVNLLRRSPDI